MTSTDRNMIRQELDLRNWRPQKKKLESLLLKPYSSPNPNFKLLNPSHGSLARGAFRQSPECFASRLARIYLATGPLSLMKVSGPVRS